MLNQISKSKYNVVPLHKLLDNLTDGTHYTPTYTNSGIKFISVTNITENDIDFLNTKYISENEHEELIKRCNPKPNDILLTKIGSIGRAAVVPKNCPEFSLFVSVALLKLKDNINPEYLCAYLNTPLCKKQFERHLKGIGVPDLHLESIGQAQIILPELSKQKMMADSIEDAYLSRHQKMKFCNEVLANVKLKMFNSLRISFEEYMPSLYSYNQLKNVREMGMYCNPHSDYLNSIFSHLMGNNYYAGYLEDFVEINPTTNKIELADDSVVSFVPMTAVGEKNNEVVYEAKQYDEVKTGFTCFKKGDLLWAKITPCMQNGKAFIASDMPTDIGFGSTEFHVLRQKSDRIYMPYLWVILSDEHILEAAQGMFSGSAGQQRVPDTFLKKLPIVLPPVEMQKELADEVFEALEESKRLCQEAEQEWQAAKEQFVRELLRE